jgi:hypothetical protein
MPRVALPDFLQLCRYLGVSTLHTFKDQHYFASFIDDRLDHYRRPLHATHLSRSYWVSSNTGNVDLRPL